MFLLNRIIYNMNSVVKIVLMNVKILMNHWIKISSVALYKKWKRRTYEITFTFSTMNKFIVSKKFVQLTIISEKCGTAKIVKNVWILFNVYYKLYFEDYMLKDQNVNYITLNCHVLVNICEISILFGRTKWINVLHWVVELLLHFFFICVMMSWTIVLKRMNQYFTFKCKFNYMWLH